MHDSCFKLVTSSLSQIMPLIVADFQDSEGLGRKWRIIKFVGEEEVWDLGFNKYDVVLPNFFLSLIKDKMTSYCLINLTQHLNQHR